MTTITMKEYRPLTVSPFLDPTEPVSCSCCIENNCQHYYHEGDYEILRSIMHKQSYPGFRYGGLDASVADQRKFVSGLAPRHLKKYREKMQNVCEQYLLQWYMEDSFKLAMEVFDFLRKQYPKLPEEARPTIDNSFLRVLYYPPGSSTTLHSDRSLFTMALWRDVDNVKTPVDCRTKLICDAYPGLQLGKYFEGLMGRATKHEIPAIDVPQRTLIYFARPNEEVWRSLLTRPL